jgi:hypothetical protein
MEEQEMAEFKITFCNEQQKVLWCLHTTNKIGITMV